VKILHVTPHYHPALGGAETHMKEISERLARRGHDVTVLAMNSWGAPDGLTHRTLKGSEAINQVMVHRFLPGAGLQRLFNGFLGMRGAHRLLGLAMGIDTIQMLAAGPYSLRPVIDSLRLDPDVVAVSNWYCGTLIYQMMQARRFRGFALVGIPLFHTEGVWSQSSLYTEMLNRCDAVVALTGHEKQFIAQRSRQDAHVVGVGVNPSVFAHAAGAPIRKRHDVGDAPLVGYVGRMTASKGVATLIAAMKRVWQTAPAVRLLLAGPGMPTGSRPGNEISAALAALSPADRSRIIMIDRFEEDDKASIFDALDLFVMPSVAESFGIAYLEAWMCGKAVIGSRIGATQCVIEDGVDGVLVTPGNADDLASSILRLLSDPAGRARMGRMGHAKTMAHFTWDRIADRIEHIYTDAHRKRSGHEPAESEAASLHHNSKSGEKCA
jgi:glycosyltransferase involved in cell wall biosynthesis